MSSGTDPVCLGALTLRTGGPSASLEDARNTIWEVAVFYLVVLTSYAKESILKLTSAAIF